MGNENTKPVSGRAQRTLIGGIAAVLLVVAGATVLRDRHEPRYEYDGRPDAERVAVDPEWVRTILSQPRDATGRSGSGVPAKAHGGGSKKKNPAYESRLYRTGFLGIEPTLGITSNGWIFYVSVTPDKANSAVIRSKDGGVTWEAVSTPRPTNDPYLWVDRKTDRIFWSDFLSDSPCGKLSFSDDYGTTWVDASPVGCGHNTDHQTIFAGPPVTSTTKNDYPNVVYYCSIGGGALNVGSTMTTCSKSLDGGANFARTNEPAFLPMATDAGPCVSGTSGHIFVGSDGTLYVPRGVCGQPWLAISQDEGNTWARVQVADTGMGQFTNSNSEPTDFWDHEAAVRTDRVGNVFYSWVARDRIPYLVVSRDHGRTWGAPIRVAPPEVNEAVLPNMDMDENGRLAFVYMASTNSPGAPFSLGCGALEQIQSMGACYSNPYAETTWTGYITLTDDPLAVAPTFISAPATTADRPLIRGQCGPFQCKEVHEFIDIEFGPNGEIVAALIDGCTDEGTCATPDGTFSPPPGGAVLATLVDPKTPLPQTPTFVTDGTLPLAFTPNPSRATGVPSLEGCASEPGKPIGLLTTQSSDEPCHSGNLMGMLSSLGVEVAQFTSAPVDRLLTIGGRARLAVNLADIAPEFVLTTLTSIEIHEITHQGQVQTRFPAGLAISGATNGFNEGFVELPPFDVQQGSRIRVTIPVGGARAAAARLLFGGEYGDSGITFTVGHWETPDAPKKASAKSESLPQSQPLVGALSPLALIALVALLAARRRRGRLAR